MQAAARRKGKRRSPCLTCLLDASLQLSPALLLLHAPAPSRTRPPSAARVLSPRWLPARLLPQKQAWLMRALGAACVLLLLAGGAFAVLRGHKQTLHRLLVWTERHPGIGSLVFFLVYVICTSESARGARARGSCRMGRNAGPVNFCRRSSPCCSAASCAPPPARVCGPCWCRQGTARTLPSCPPPSLILLRVPPQSPSCPPPSWRWRPEPSGVGWPCRWCGSAPSAGRRSRSCWGASS